MHFRTVSLARRFPVREERSKGWRTRAIDDETEGGVSHTTLSSDRARYDGIRDLASGALLFFRQGIVPKFWKRHVKCAYRRAPIRRSDEEFFWFVFVWRGSLWVARHHGMMFGATAANAAWHRLGSFVSYYIVIKFEAFLSRYVDDYFGASRDGVMVTGGTLLADILELLGLCTDSTKDNDDTLSLPVLGSLVTVHLKHRSVTTQVAPQKAKWADLLEQQRLQSEMSSTTALKMAGRLGSAVTSSMCKVGRAFIKPFFAQAFAPLLVYSPLLLRASLWWEDYLRSQHLHHRYADVCRRHRVTLWTDAAGESRRIAAVFARHGPDGTFTWEYTRIWLPESVWDHLLDREDHQIGYQEFIAFAVAYHSFGLSEVLLVEFIDNDGVLLSLLRGSSRLPEVNFGVGMTWQDMAARDISLLLGRVESCPNIVDGPSRDDLSHVLALQAKFVELVYPAWVLRTWNWEVTLSKS